jgi:hypothetical protein
MKRGCIHVSEKVRDTARLDGINHPKPIILSFEEREAIDRSKAAAARGEFATDEQVRTVWAKHGLRRCRS